MPTMITTKSNFVSSVNVLAILTAAAMIRRPYGRIGLLRPGMSSQRDQPMPPLQDSSECWFRGRWHLRLPSHIGSAPNTLPQYHRHSYRCNGSVKSHISIPFARLNTRRHRKVDRDVWRKLERPGMRFRMFLKSN